VQDEDLIFVNKSAGMVVHPAAGISNNTLVNGIAFHLKDQHIKDACVDGPRPGIVHRLDKGTSGILVVAKRTPAYEHLQHSFSERQVHKVYIAITIGLPTSLGGKLTVREPIGRNKRFRQEMCVHPDGRAATSHIFPIASDGKLCINRVVTETGRTHQIRVHLSHLR
jgi:23S rRNA pseudouridine1911/1915/1917 synthase